MKFFTTLRAAALCALLLSNSTVARPVGSDGKVVIAYWADWTGTSVSSIDFSKITHVLYAFSTMNSSLLPTTPGGLSSFVSTVHGANTKALLSIGGWTSSGFFSTVAATATARRNFANAVQKIISQNNLDGIDLDWEYPGEAGACGNIVSAHDSANYLLLLQAIRKAVGNKLITGATATHPFVGTDGKPLADVSKFARYFDWINLMAFDLGGTSGLDTAPNTPLREGKNGGSPANVVQAVKDWSAAGFPYSKLSMANNDPSDQYVPVKGGSTNHTCEGGGFSSTQTWKAIRSSALSGPTTAAAGWIRKFDPCTQTPWLFNTSTLEYISRKRVKKKYIPFLTVVLLLKRYDDPQSLQVKVNYAGCMGLKGMMLWEISDDNGELLPVLDSIKNVKTGTKCLPSTGGPTSSSSTPRTSNVKL
ncbi:glycoside hydrolase superfamily [Jimgerdemannia flammicorona]|uniref:Glycoside hydrolase superfamily n=1 Tax=Jimgerdemannia flammicorona TaxID=994334 RepID=A0A433D3V6_9FUNG|nr:glycoside hydrolase superfamily [Jimgerdemannia flammicorona]